MSKVGRDRSENRRLIRARTELGLTQSDVARLLSVGPSVVCALEGQRKPAWGEGGLTDTALRMATFYGHDPEYLWPKEIGPVRRVALRQECAAGEAFDVLTIDDAIDLRALYLLLSRLLLELPPRDRLALKLRHEEDLTLDEIAHAISPRRPLSRERTRHILFEAEAWLRHEIGVEHLRQLRLRARKPSHMRGRSLRSARVKNILNMKGPSLVEQLLRIEPPLRVAELLESLPKHSSKRRALILERRCPCRSGIPFRQCHGYEPKSSSSTP